MYKSELRILKWSIASSKKHPSKLMNNTTPDYESRKRALVAIIATLGAIWLSIAILSPSSRSIERVLDSHAEARILRHLTTLSSRPRPMGSDGHALALGYITNALSSLKLEWDLQETFVVSASAPTAGTVRNVSARFRGRGTARKTLLVCAHYDSTAHGPGASDNACAVATLLEAARALASMGQLANDFILLFSDGEEQGMLGVKAWLREHEWAKGVDVALNFDARGNSGPVLMFESSEENDSLLREYARCAPDPIAYSVSEAIYAMLPNATDFSPLIAGGIKGLNFAHFYRPYAYDNALDTADRLDRRSLRHQAATALALVRHFARTSFEAPKRASVYFTFPHLGVLRYPRSWVATMSVVLTLVIIATLIVEARKKRLTRQITFAVAGLFTIIAMTIGVGFLIANAAPMVFGELARFYEADKINLGGALLSTAIVLGAAAVLPRFIPAADIAGAGLLVACVPVCISGFFLPAAHHLFFGQLFCHWIAFCFERGKRWWAAAGLHGLALLWFLPVLYVVLKALMWWQVMLVAGFTALGVVPWASQVLALLGRWRWSFPGLAFISFASVVLMTLALIQPSPTTPALSSLFYCLNLDNRTATWVTLGQGPDDWNRPLFGADARRLPLAEACPWLKFPMPVTMGSAPSCNQEGGRLELLSSSTNGRVRITECLMRSGEPAAVLSVAWAGDGWPRSATIQGVELTHFRHGPEHHYRDSTLVDVLGITAAGAILRLETNVGDPVSLWVMERQFDFGPMAGNVPKRPAHLIPQPFSLSDASVLYRSYSF